MGLLRQFLDGALTLEKCLARIAARDFEIRAWVEVAPQPALGDGPLRGAPFGVKDIFETRNLATEYGSPLYAGRKGDRDAALVDRIRCLGGVLLGKTQTTAFAYFDPAPTRNPRDPERTPGGSSSGSAAAVAAGMATFALGTQTQGSVIRPASFCGVCGFKPTFGLLPLEGVLPFAPSLDTAGLFTEDAEDMQLLWELLGLAADAVTPARIGACYWDPEPPMRTAFTGSLRRLSAAGFRVEDVDLPADVLPAVRLINHYEGARTHERRWRQHGAALGEKLARLIEEGLAMPEEPYRQAVAVLAARKQDIAKLLQEFPLLATPAAPGYPPLGLASTGDPRMNSPWTGLGVPAITVPMPLEGPPLGLQLVAAAGADSALLQAARVVENARGPKNSAVTI